MINVLYVSGSFGSTMAYCLKSFGTLYESSAGIDHSQVITKHGSMHNFIKTGHFTNKLDLVNYLNSDAQIDIITPLYPIKQCSAKEVIELFKQYRNNEKNVFIYVKDLKYAEINMLCQYYKVYVVRGLSPLTVICGDNRQNITAWDSSYKHWSDMKVWELREWLSIFYPVWVQEWIDAKQYANTDWSLISTDKILSDPKFHFKRILEKNVGFNYAIEQDYITFIDKWRNAQQYILDEYALTGKIIESTINQQSFTWNKISIISEAIIQQRLRTLGYEIRCHNLNEFPTDSETLFSLLEKL
jgi:hypothetical protein